MRFIRLIMALGLAIGLGACASGERATRNAPVEVPFLQAESPAWNVQAVRVIVPETLRVSEANVFFPIADIVWHGEARGNRYEQVARILEEGVRRGVAGLHGPRAVVMDIEVLRFHALTDKARYTFGGSHSIKFILTVRDALTGEALSGPTHINADFKAYGGQRAIRAEMRGETQKKRILEHLAALIQSRFAAPGPGGQPEQPRRAAVDQDAD